VADPIYVWNQVLEGYVPGKVGKVYPVLSKHRHFVVHDLWWLHRRAVQLDGQVVVVQAQVDEGFILFVQLKEEVAEEILDAVPAFLLEQEL
jgi:hypothetical protein